MPLRGIVELCFGRVGDAFFEIFLWGPWNTRAGPCMLGHPYFHGQVLRQLLEQEPNGGHTNLLIPAATGKCDELELKLSWWAVCCSVSEDTPLQSMDDSEASTSVILQAGQISIH